MPHLRFRCSSCDKVLQIDESFAGQNIKCPSCQTVNMAPSKHSASTVKPMDPAKPVSKSVASVNQRPTQSKSKNVAWDDFSSTPLPQSTYPNRHDTSWKTYQPEFSGPVSAPPILPIVLVAIFAFLTLAGIGAFFGVKSYWAYASRVEDRQSPNVINNDSPKLNQSVPGTSSNQQNPDTSDSETEPVTETEPATTSQSIATPPPMTLPQFPELGSGRSISGIRLYDIQLRTANTSNDPGFRTRMRIYVPETATEPRSVPCVLVAPAGTTLLHGRNIDDATYHKETLPYARAGMAVVHYSIDGWLSTNPSTASEQQQVKAMSLAFKEFLAADAGITNGRVALEFVLARLPQVDPSKIYSAGHSSAATLALQLAAKEPRIAKCVAYAPMVDHRFLFSELLLDPEMEELFTGVREYANSKSLLKLASEFKCPVFIFHSKDDSNQPWEKSESLFEALQSAGKDCTFESVPHGDHFQSMIDVGIPKGIEWLKK